MAAWRQDDPLDFSLPRQRVLPRRGLHAAGEADVLREHRARDHEDAMWDLESQQPDFFAEPTLPWSDEIGREY